MSVPCGLRRVAIALAVAVLAVSLTLVSGTTLGQTDATLEIDDVRPETVQVDETVTVTYTANGTGITDDDVTLVFEHPRGEEVVIDGQSGTNVTQEIDLEPHEIDPGPYDLRVEVDGGPTTESVGAIEVEPLYDPDDANFGATESSTDDVVATYEGVAGDFVAIDVSLNDVDEAFVVVGGDRAVVGDQSDAPLDILHVDGSATFVVNTRLVGTDRPSEEVYIPVDGDVTSYAHELGADAEPAGVFESLHFETEAYEQVAETLTEFRREAKVGAQARPLQPGDVSLVIAGGNSLVITDEGMPDARFPLDRANLRLTEPALENVTAYRLPTANADDRAFKLDPDDIDDLEPGDIDGLLDEATEADTLAYGDRLLISVDATGLYGALLDGIEGGSERIEDGESDLVGPAEFGTLIDRPEGISLEFVHQNPGPNVPETTVNLFDAPTHEVSVLTAPALGELPTETSQLFFIVDTREPTSFDPELGIGDEYEVRVSYTPPIEEKYRFLSPSIETLPEPFEPYNAEHASGVYPYLEPSEAKETRTTSFAVEKPFVEYDRTTDDGEPVVATATDAHISGTTNIAPGEDLPVSLIVDVRDDPTTVEIEGIDIDENGTFAVETDLSMLDPDDEVDVEFVAYQQSIDERLLRVVDEDDVGGTFEITELTAESIVTAQGTFADLTAAITNTGLVTDTQRVELVLDNEEVANETLEIDPGQTRLPNFDDVLDELEPGEYPLEIRTDDDLEGLMLVVEDAEGVFEVTDISAEQGVEDEMPVLEFETTVRNTGTINESSTVELLLDGGVVGERTADLLVEQDVTYTFENELGDLGPGNYTLTVRTPDDEATTEVTLEEPHSTLELTDIDVQTTVQQGETVEPAVVVNNTGNVPGSGSVTVRLEEHFEDWEIELGPGENQTVVFEEIPVDYEPGAYTLVFETSDDQQTVELVVEAPEQESEESDEDESDEDGSEEDERDSPGFLGLGVSTRAVVGATAITAGIHVLGHWV